MPKYEHVSCDLCGLDNYKVRYRKPDDWLWLNKFEFPVVECLDCGLVYVNPRPVKEEMHHYYINDYHEGRNSLEHKIRYEKQSKFLNLRGDEVILDVGAARCDFLHFLQSEYPALECVGIDLYSTKSSHQNIEFYCADLLDKNLSEKRFDLVTAWAVMEHVYEPKEYFTKINKLLKPGGRFVFLVTNADSLYGRKAYKEDIPRHTFHFSERSLNAYAKKTGFGKIKYHYTNDFWDGTGGGTFQYMLENLVGIQWHQRKSRESLSLLQKCFTRIGMLLDKIVFSFNWETKIRYSGIFVVEYFKD
jgi:ubiquinone/menaquinone biosynthesis C-methylase UbiE